MKLKLAFALLILAGGSAGSRETTPAASPGGDASSARVALGRTLFFDARLSGNRNIACGTCHYHRTGSSDGLSLAVGEGSVGAGTARVQGRGKVLSRRAPALFDRAHLPALFWDGRVSSASGHLELPVALPSSMAEHVTTPLAAQALLPPLDQDEMRGEPGTNEVALAATPEAAWAAIMKRLLADAHLAGLFRAAFPGVRDLDFGHAAVAIAAFEADKWSDAKTPLDALHERPLSNEARDGERLFLGKAGCVKCHSGPYLSDGKLHALAVPQVGPRKDDRGGGGYRFRTPPLGNTALAGAWMHDGCFTTLEAVVRHHLDPRASLASFDPAPLQALAATHDRDPARQAERIAAVDPLLEKVSLEDREVRALVAFLEALTDPKQADQSTYHMGAMATEGVMPGMMMMRTWKKGEKTPMALTVGR